jgi:hypothetical protein
MRDLEDVYSDKTPTMLSFLREAFLWVSTSLSEAEL